jgi:hypothetical protein
LDVSFTDTVSADVRFNGMMTVVFENCFSEAPDSFAVYVPPGYHADHIGPVIVDNLHGTPTLGTIDVLHIHPTDDNHLTPDEILDHKSFDTRSAFLHPYWNTFHHCKSLHDIKIFLECMDSGDHAMLVALHEAYANHFVDITTSFGHAKAAYWTFAHGGHFNYDSFDTYPQKDFDTFDTCCKGGFLHSSINLIYVICRGT